MYKNVSFSPELLLIHQAYVGCQNFLLYWIVVSFSLLVLLLLFVDVSLPPHSCPRSSGRVTGPWLFFCLHRMHPAVLRDLWEEFSGSEQCAPLCPVCGRQHRAVRPRAPQEGKRVLSQQLLRGRLPFPGTAELPTRRWRWQLTYHWEEKEQN